MDEECLEQALSVDYPMFPVVLPPAVEFEDETFYDISMRGPLVEFGVEYVVSSLQEGEGSIPCIKVILVSKPFL